jgi:hypothetical protein
VTSEFASIVPNIQPTLLTQCCISRFNRIYPVAKALIHLVDSAQSRQIIVHFLCNHLNQLKRDTIRGMERRAVAEGKSFDVKVITSLYQSIDLKQQ